MTDMSCESNNLDSADNYSINGDVISIFKEKVKSNPTNIIEYNKTVDSIHDLISEAMINDSKQVFHSSTYKKYIIQQKIDGAFKTFSLLIKILTDNIFVYVTDLNNEYTGSESSAEKLIYVASINNNVNKIKFVQISNDFKLISLPENNSINIYDLKNLLLQNELICIGTIDDIKNIYQPYKCILCDNLFIVIYTDGDNYKNIIAFDHKNDQTHEINNLSIDINKSILKFSSNGKFVFIYDNVKMTMILYSMINVVYKPIYFNIKNISFETVCLSDDGNLIFYIENMMCNIYDVINNNTYKLNKTKSLKNMSDYKFYLLDYSDLSDIDILSRFRSDKFYDKLYVLVAWDRNLINSFYQIIRFSHLSERGYIFYDPYPIGIKINGKIDYLYCNNHMIIYKTINDNNLTMYDDITSYDLNMIIPIRFAGLLAFEARKILMALYQNKYLHNNEKNKYYTNIEIMGADNSKVLYELDDFMTFFLSIPKNMKADINVFGLKVNANINMSPIDTNKNASKNYNTCKSFNIFKNLVTGKINQTEIISNLFTIKGTIGCHNMMYELMSHMCEYARIITIKDESEGVPNNNINISLNDIKILYIGYILIVLILKYYAAFFKTNKKFKIQINKDHLFNTIKIFNQNFPIFEGFVFKALNLMINQISIDNVNNI